MSEIQTLFGNIDLTQPRFHDGRFGPVKKDPQGDIKIHLEAGLSLTVLDCIKLYRTTELRRVISRLRKSGMNIADTWHMEGNKRAYKVYKLKKEI